MLQYDADDLPGVKSWWEEAAYKIACHKRDTKDRDRLDGRRKKQNRERGRNYYARNREAVLAAQKAKRDAIKDTPEWKAKISAKAQRYLAKNRDKVNERRRAKAAILRGCSSVTSGKAETAIRAR